MTTKKRIFWYSFLVILCSIHVYNFIIDVKYHNSNHAPSINGEKMKESDGYFFSSSQDSSKVCYYVKTSLVQENCNCWICKHKEALLIKAGIALNIINEQKLAAKDEDSISQDLGVIMTHN